MAPLSVLLGDYPHTRPVKDGVVDCAFPPATPLYPNFARMVRDLAFDVCELALATYLQAREAGVPITLLPVVLIGNAHHGSLTRLPGGAARSPRDLVGKRVGVRSYSQTTGMWVRGILREEYGIDASDITWVTTEEPHVAGAPEPSTVVRAASGTVAELVRDGDVAAAVLGPRAVGGQGIELVPVIEDAASAGRAWITRHRTVPANHLLVARTDVLRERPDAVRALYRALVASIEATADERDDSPAGQAVTAGWSDGLARCLEIADRYARQQHLVSTRLDVDRLAREFDPA